jgi:NitT/TauT family transport system ATP-binding protein
VDEALAAVGLSHAANLYPWQLSGGMQQRTALARSLAASPKLLLLDEPFASVDAQTRMDLQDLVMRICQELRLSTLLVTHDIDEAVLMADRVVVLSSRPARVVEEIRVALRRPRDQLATKESPDFLHLRHRVFTAVRQEVKPASMNASQRT